MTKKIKEIELPEFYFAFQVFLLRITGIELIEKDEPILYRMYSVFTLSFAITYVLVEIVELTRHSDFATVSIITWYIIHHSLTMVKAVVIYKNRKGIGILMRSFHEGYYKPNKKRGWKFEEQCIHDMLKRSGLHITLYAYFIIFACSSAEIVSLHSRLTESPENWALPYVPSTLVNVTRSPAFEFLYVYQAVGTTIICTWLYLCDSTVISIIAQTGAQLKILERYVRNYRSIGREVEDNKRSTSKTLYDAVNYHLNILSTVDEVEYLCSYLVLCVFLANCILLCFTMYYASVVPVRSIEFARYLMYTIAIGYQIFLYCWWGNEITFYNESLAMGIYETYNPNEPTFHAKALKLMLIKAQRPLFFTAGKFVPLSLETYKAIMKGSFSYFIVLRQMNSK